MVKYVEINFGDAVKGTLTYNQKTLTVWGQKGRKYKKDVTVTGIEGTDKFKKKFSQEFSVDMPWAVLIDGQFGLYIHEWPDNLESAGCIHASKGAAEEFWKWVDGPTRIVINHPW